MSNLTDNAAEVGKHKFELAGLGKAPFRFTGMSENVVKCGDEVKAGGSCDYCSTSIRFEFHIQSADGKRSKVGCNCVEKVGDVGLMRAYKSSPEYRKAQAAKRAAKDAAVFAELRAIFAAKETEWKSQPHPRGFVDYRTNLPMTRWDSEVGYLNCCGAAGRARFLKSLKSQ